MSSKSIEDRIPMLDGSNYLEWEKIMYAYLRSKGLWQITSGGDIRPTPLNPTADPKPSVANIAERNKKIADWDKENDKALGLIQMKRTISLSTYDESTSCSTWNRLKKTFATPTATAVFDLMTFRSCWQSRFWVINTLVQKWTRCGHLWSA